MGGALENIFYVKMLRELGLLSLEKRKLSGDLNNAYKYRQGRCQDDGDRLFSVVTTDRTRHRGNKLKHRRVHPISYLSPGNSKLLCKGQP